MKVYMVSYGAFFRVGSVFTTRELCQAQADVENARWRSTLHSVVEVDVIGPWPMEPEAMKDVKEERPPQETLRALLRRAADIAWDVANTIINSDERHVELRRLSDDLHARAALLERLHRDGRYRPISAPPEPAIIPSTRYFIAAVNDASTCTVCRDRSGSSILVPDGERPPVIQNGCEYVRHKCGECRCVMVAGAAGEAVRG